MPYRLTKDFLELFDQDLSADDNDNVRDILQLLEAQGTQYHQTLKALVQHWREFGPEYGFDELIEEAANRHGINGS